MKGPPSPRAEIGRLGPHPPFASRSRPVRAGEPRAIERPEPAGGTGRPPPSPKPSTGAIPIPTRGSDWPWRASGSTTATATADSRGDPARACIRDPNYDLAMAWTCSLAPRGLVTRATARLIDDLTQRVPIDDDPYGLVVRRPPTTVPVGTMKRSGASGGSTRMACNCRSAACCWRCPSSTRRPRPGRPLAGPSPGIEPGGGPESFWWSQEVDVLRHEAEVLILDRDFPSDPAGVFHR